MADPAAIRTALATALRAAFTVENVFEYVMSNPTAPAFEIDLDDEGTNYDEAMGRGLDEWWFVVRGFVAENVDIASQTRRDEWLASSGARSVKRAIEVDRTLGGACSAARVVSARPRSFEARSAPNVIYTAAEWRVRVMATG